MNKYSLAIFALVLIVTGCKKPDANSYNTDLSKFFTGYYGCFIMYDEANNFYLRYNDSLCETQLSPSSKFLFTDTLIGLQSSVITFDTIERNNRYIFSGKSGNGKTKDGKYSGWFVGSISQDNGVYNFALKITSTTDSANGQKAKEISINILKSLKLF